MNKIIQVYDPDGRVARVSLVPGESAKIIVGQLHTFTYLLEEQGWNCVREENSGYPLSETLGYGMLSSLGYNNFVGTIKPPNTSYENTFYFAKPDIGRIATLLHRKRQEIDDIERRYSRGEYTDSEVIAKLGGER